MTGTPEPKPDRISAIVSEAWSRALAVDDVRETDDFFALGGHSLLVLEVADHIEAETGLAVPLHLFFEEPTPRAIADYVRSHAGGAHG